MKADKITNWLRVRRGQSLGLNLSLVPTPNTDAGEGGTGQTCKSLTHPGCTYRNGTGKVPRKGQKAGPQPRLYSSDGGWVTIRGRRENLLEPERKGIKWAFLVSGLQWETVTEVGGQGGFPDWQRGEPVSHAEVIGGYSTQDGTKYVFYKLQWDTRCHSSQGWQVPSGANECMTPEPYYQTLSCSVFIPSVPRTRCLCHSLR